MSASRDLWRRACPPLRRRFAEARRSLGGGGRSALAALPRDFRILFREFFEQFFRSEIVTSDIVLRQTMIWVLAFLITPGWFLSFRMGAAYAAMARQSPELIEPMTRLLGTMFIAFSTVSVGLIAAFVWDSLSFDRRDAMVLGPLPTRPAVVVTAKLAAMAAFLVGACLAINLLTALPFSLMASGPKGLLAVGRHFVAHMVATSAAAVFVFSMMVIGRALLGMVARGHLASACASLLQFVFVSALLCGVLVPPMLGRRARARLAAIPDWLPTEWFVGLYEQLRGTAWPELTAVAPRAVVLTLAALLGATLVTIVGYRRQMQLALSPSATPGAMGAARVSRALARAIVGRNGVARATADFILLTLARSRAQQAQIAMNAAIALPLVVAGLSKAQDLSSLMFPRTIVLWIPLLIAYWTTIGLRASAFVPSELPAAWSFHANAPARTTAYWSAVRASMLAVVLPLTLILIAAIVVPLLGWRLAAWHALLSCAIVTLLVEVVALTLDFIPFTRAYQPGHSKLRTRWPIYVFGMYAVAYWPVQLELRILGNVTALLEMVGVLAAAIAVVEIIGRKRAVRRWVMKSSEELETEASHVIVLNLAGASP